jgi:hypothetical protein
MKAMGQFFADGSLPKFNQAKACAELQATSVNQLSHVFADTQAFMPFSQTEPNTNAMIVSRSLPGPDGGAH